MTKELIIIALIIVIIYLYYQQNSSENNQSPHIIESPNTQQLRSELNHYQKLYEKKIKQDLGYETKEQATQIFTDYEGVIEDEKAKHNEQLRKINLLFDENANSYESIDFEGLYALLASIVERERERAK